MLRATADYVESTQADLETLRRLLAHAYAEDGAMYAWAGHLDLLESLADTYGPPDDQP